MHVSLRGYIRVHVGMFGSSISFGEQEKPLSIGEGLLQFIYADLHALTGKGQNEPDPAGIHPYFSFCDKQWLSLFLKNLTAAEPDPALPDIHSLSVLQNRYRDFLTTVYGREQMPDSRKLREMIRDCSWLTDMSCYSEICIGSDFSAKDCCLDYFVTCFEECLYVELLELMRRRIHLKTCRNCGKLFLPRRSNADYCQRISQKDGKTCAEIGYARTFSQNVRNDELLQAYTRAYKAHYARMSKPRKKAPNMTREEFNSWYHEARQKLDEARSGRIDGEEYKAWLKK